MSNALMGALAGLILAAAVMVLVLVETRPTVARGWLVLIFVACAATVALRVLQIVTL